MWQYSRWLVRHGQLVEGRSGALGIWRKWVIGVSGSTVTDARDDLDDLVVGPPDHQGEQHGEQHGPVSPEEAFSQLYRSMHDELRAYLVRRVDLDLVDDVLADTFLVVWRRWADLPTSLSNRRAWVYGIVRNKVLQATDSVNRQLRLTRRASSVLHVDSVLDPDLEGLHEAQRLLALLPPAERDALRLVVFVGLTSTETATVLGCSVSSVTTRVARARKRLRAILIEQDRARTHR